VRTLSTFALLLLAACASTPPPVESDSEVWRFLRATYDADGDGRIERAEYTRSAHGFANLDADGDGRVTAADFDPAFDGVPRVADFVYGEGGPEVGDPAPPFELESTAGERIALADFAGVQPVVLVFGSFT
jgi:hypothetical protein